MKTIKSIFELELLDVVKMEGELFIVTNTASESADRYASRLNNLPEEAVLRSYNFENGINESCGIPLYKSQAGLIQVLSDEDVANLYQESIAA